MRIGIDLNRNGILGVLVENSIVVTSLNKPIEYEHQNKQEVLNNLLSVISGLLNSNVKGIGISLPSKTDPSKGIVYDLPYIPNWKGTQLKKIVEKEFHIPAYINNDINCMMLGEKYHGICKENKNIICISLESQIVAGAMVDDKLYMDSKKTFENSKCLSKAYYHLTGIDRKKYLRAVEELQFFFKTYNEELKDPDHELWVNVGIITGRLISSLLENFEPETIVLSGDLPLYNDIYSNAIMEYADLFISSSKRTAESIAFIKDKNTRAIGACYLVPNAA